MKVGRYKIVLKPLTYLIIAACVIGVIGGPIIIWAVMFRATALPDFGYVRPDRWKFETKGGAVASVAPLGESSNGRTLITSQGTFLSDMRQGISIKVDATGNSPNNVYLRNGMNLTQAVGSNDLEFRVDAKSSVKSPILVVIRNSATPLWRQKFDVQGDWQEYKATIPIAELRKTTNNNLIVAIQLAYQPGEISLRNIQVRNH